MRIILLVLFALFSNLNAQTVNKVYILSEGSFSPGTAQLGLITTNPSGLTNSIFQPGSLGLYPDGLVYHNNYLYVTEQGSFGSAGRIMKLDTTGLLINSRTIGTNPYSLTISNEKIYITNGPASNVSVIKLDDFSDVKTIPVGIYPQEILSIGDYVFVANNSLYGGAVDSTVSVIDATIDSVVETINVGKDPSSLAIGPDGDLFIGVPAGTGKIIRLEPQTLQIKRVYNLPSKGFGNELNANTATEVMYYLAGTNDVVKYDPADSSETVIIESVFPNNYYYGYAHDFNEGNHYLLDAKNFMVSGYLSVHQENGALLYGNSVGIAPRRVVFKYYETPSGVDDNIYAEGFSLSQNYPNPFNPITTIKFSVPTPLNPPFGKGGTQGGSLVTLKVYDVMGREVSTLVNDNKEQGNYEVQFDAAGLSSGIYFYRLSAGKYSETKKMTLLR